ncbi:pseudouridine synthase [Spirosoma arcticum]
MRRSDTGRSDDARPRFSRDSNDRSRPGGSGRGRTGKPAGSPDRFKRVGGFSREADERNRENWSEGRTPESRTSGPDKRDNRDAGDAADRPRDAGSRDARPRNDRSEGRSDRGRGREPQGGESNSRNTRFTPEQRKDSGDRRTGFFVKAPNYELEQQRRAGQIDAPRTPRPRTDKYENMPPKSRSNRGGQEEKPTPAGEPGTTRLNRYIANSGVCSRREADELIARGDITVNGKVVTEMGFRVKEGDMVKYGTKALTPERFVYVLLNKPKDYITTTEDPEERKTVMELVADAGNFRMYPVGRLDRKTTGLLLLTNDGELADKLTHPSNEARKIYQVELDKPITEEHFDTLKKGIELEDGPIKPDALSIVTPDAYVVGIEIHSGRNRIVRRMFESLGYEVTKLDRTAYAGLTKKELPRGKWRFLDPKEVVKLKYLS